MRTTVSGREVEALLKEVLRRLEDDASQRAAGSCVELGHAISVFKREWPHLEPASALERLRPSSEPETSTGALDPVTPSFLSPRLAETLAVTASAEQRYRIEGEIGRGGMGSVLAAFDPVLRRRLAMKVVLEQAGGPREGRRREEHLARFLEEAQVTAQLDHPGIVPVHELGLDGGGRFYFTMKLVKGRNLRAVFDLVHAGEEGWNETRALGVVLKVCEAMAFAHSKGVIHRDLKPANVMVGDFGEVYVMDWGLARVLAREETRDLRLRPETGDTAPLRTERLDEREETPHSPLVTMDGDVVGTPAYMPPEQALGQVERLSPRSDVYAIGAMLYHLLGGRAPYSPAGDRAVLLAVVQGPPEPLDRLRRDVPAELSAIVAKAMSRAPEQRYRDTLALAEDLRAYLEQRVVRAYETGAIAELRKWIARNRPLASALLAAASFLVLGSVTASVLYAKARTNAERAERAATSAELRADEVLRLSALQRLAELTDEAAALWPADPDRLLELEQWRLRARDLIRELPDHRRKLTELAASALPPSPEEGARARAAHPRAAELAATNGQLEHLRTLQAALDGSVPFREPTAADVGVDPADLPRSAAAVNALAWGLVDPGRQQWGSEARGLVLARLAVELAAELPPIERAGMRDTYAWALFANGGFDEALAQEEQAVEEARGPKEPEFAAYLARLRDRIAEERAPDKRAERAARLDELEQRAAALEAEISARLPRRFANAEEQWWYDQLVELVAGIEAFADPETGLATTGISAEHGWGIERRAEYARTIVERSLSGSEATKRWAEAIANIADPSRCPLYGGMRITPQLGLLPIGRDPVSGLWEFAHLATGEPAGRGLDGSLVLEEDTGLVLVLLPRGTFTMGAQRDDPDGPNHDPRAESDEGPPHVVKLSPFFLSKYEMTQGQWLRFAGNNPSQYGPAEYSAAWNREGRAGDLLHPVERVSWEDCAELVARMGLELPTEAQWEYGARAGTSTVWWTGDDVSALDEAGNVSDAYAKAHAGESWGNHELALDDGNTSHAPVGSFRPNAFGLHDVIGNEWEWCGDGYQQDFYRQGYVQDPLSDPASSSHRVLRGGAFGFAASGARSSMRYDASTGLANPSTGVRPALSLRP
jgi:formylglycine-generating enzyme required for sulfatase activity/serine/threonine protein kinase